METHYILGDQTLLNTRYSIKAYLCPEQIKQESSKKFHLRDNPLEIRLYDSLKF